MSGKVGIIGASGFIGGRTVEMLHLGGALPVRAVVRTAAGLARLSRFELDWRVADARSESSMVAALEGCDAAVHAIAAEPAGIVASIAPVYRAAEKLGLKRLVYLSSASVHGQSPPPGTDEATPLDDRQALAYNNAKVRAERELMQLRDNGSVEVVILRPGIVAGPRSSWIVEFAAELLAGTAYWMNDGKGICNSIYVDNLVHAIQLALASADADGQAFIVADEETITWADLYRPIAQALGFDLSHIVNAAAIEPRQQSWRDRLDRWQSSPGIGSALRLMPKRIRRAAYSLLAPAPGVPPSPWQLAPAPLAEPQASLERALLYQCSVRLPDLKARRILGYRPKISFAQGCERTLGWMAFAGYPLKRAATAVNGYSAR